MKNEVLNSVKQQLVVAVNTITLENLSDIQLQMMTYFDFLEQLKGLQTFAPISTNVIHPPAPVAEPVIETQPAIPEEKSFLFERKLRGGLILNFRGSNYPIPEKLMRDMGLEHGDRVIAGETIYINGMPRVRFEIVEKGDGSPVSNRVQLDYCIVESKQLGYQVSRYQNGDILVDGEPYAFRLDQKDILDYNLRDGDLIDVAYYNNAPDGIKVLWKHDIKDLRDVPTPKQAPAKKSQVTDEVDGETKYPFDLSLFKGKKLVIVGSQYEKAKYQKACEMLGIELVHMTGDEGKVRLRTSIKKADVVVITTQHVGHKGSIPTVELCKEYNVPMASVDRNGVQYILLEAERVIKRKIEQATA